MDGIEQELINTLYKNAPPVFNEYQQKSESTNEYEKDYYREWILLNSVRIFGSNNTTILGNSFPEFKSLAAKIEYKLDNIRKIAEKSIEKYFTINKTINRSILEYGQHFMKKISKRYHRFFDDQGQFFIFRYARNENRWLLADEHTDYSPINLLPTATDEELEALIDGEWLPLQPQPGHVLILQGGRTRRRKLGKNKSS